MSRGRSAILIGSAFLALSSLGFALEPADALGATAGTPVPQGRSRAISQDLTGATLEYTPAEAKFDAQTIEGTAYSKITLEGTIVVEKPGRPALPTATLHVGVPDGMSPRIKIVSEEWNERAGPAPPVPVQHQRFVSEEPGKVPTSEITIQPDPAVYGRANVYPAQAVTLGQGAGVGEMWVVPIHIRPVRWNPSTRAYRLLRRMTVRVDFVPATDSERAARPAFRPGGDVGPFRRIQESLVQNYESARSFPIRPKSRPAPSARARVAVNPEFKIPVTQTGWTSVSYTVLSGAGFPPGISIGTVTVSERGYDDVADSAVVTEIPVVARDSNTNGTFDAGDAITFYARSLEDRLGQDSIENRYADANVYWLTWTGATAAVPDTIAGAIPGTPVPSLSFLDRIRMEQNNHVWPAPDPQFASPPEAVDFLFWTTGSEDQNQDRFQQSFSFLDPDTTMPFRVRSYYQGKNGSTHRLNIHLASGGGETDTLARNAIFFHRDIYELDTGFTVPGTHMAPGASQYRHIGERESSLGGIFIPGSAALLNWIEVTYPRRYVARSNVLQFGSGSVLSLVELTVTGFTTNQIEIYDVTNPIEPERVDGVSIVPSGGGFAAVFRTNAAFGERLFVALTPGAENAVAASSVRQDAASTLTVPSPFGASNVARTILIAPEPFLTPATRLADYRRAQGYVVEIATVEDVYDEFNGGVKSPRAIRRYVRRAFNDWTPRPAYVVLAGDASQDYKAELPGSGVDWIPTYFRFETILGPRGEELVANESYYSLDLDDPLADPTDFVPDVSLSRIPAATAADLDLFVTKVVQYENFQPTDTWRGRQLLVSDDEYSTGIVGTSSYCFSSQEALFRDTNVAFSGTAEFSRGGADMQSRVWNLRDYTDGVPPNAQQCKDLVTVIGALNAPGNGYDSFTSEMSSGALIMNVQSHANRYLIAHEQIYCNGSAVFCNSQSPGPSRVQNNGKPSLLMIWGCHANQFADGPSLIALNFDNSQAIGEQWLLMDGGRGSIASVGSTAYEFLHTNSQYNQLVADALYTRPPAAPLTPGGPLRSRWIVGEVFGRATIQNGMTPDPQQQFMNWTVNLLGDPMLRMDALPPRVYDVRLNGVTVADNAPLTSDSPTDSVAIVARTREENAIRTVSLAELDVATGNVTPIDSTRYSVAFTDSGRVATLTGKVRPRNGNYDVQVRATDTNGRLQIFSLQVRVGIRYLADGVDIVDGVFVSNAAMLRAEVTTPVPVTADSLQLLLDGFPIVVSKNGGGRQWVLEGLPGPGPGTHTLQVAVGGRTAGFDPVTFQVSAEFVMRGVAVVSPRIQGAGCGGSVFQYELSSPADRVELQLLTVAGRRVDMRQLTGNAGFNVYCWDGRDSQGHDTATGVYLYRLRATDATGKTVSYDGRMIRSR